MPFIVVLGLSIEIGVACSIVRVLRALALASPIVAGATGAMTTSRHGRVGWGGVPNLIDLDLGRFDVHGDLLDLWSPLEFF